MREAVMHLLKYQVEKMEFNVNEEFQNNKCKKIELNQNLERIITKIDDNNVKVSLKFDIYNMPEKQVPFTISIIVSGIFELVEWEKEENKILATTNTVAILFPYLRALVSMLTSNANVPTYILPVINIAALLDEKESKKN